MKKFITVLVFCLLSASLFAAPWANEYHKDPKVVVSILREDAEDVDMSGKSNRIYVEIAAESMAKTFDRNQCFVLIQKALADLMSDSGYVYSTESVKPYIREQTYRDLSFTQLICEYELSR